MPPPEGTSGCACVAGGLVALVRGTVVGTVVVVLVVVVVVDVVVLVVVVLDRVVGSDSSPLPPPHPKRTSAELRASTAALRRIDSLRFSPSW